jgi:hypothetical protein
MSVRAMVLVFLLAFGFYANSIPNAFTWDDHSIVERNALVQGVGRIPDIWKQGYWGEGKMVRQYRPVALTSFALESAIHGVRPAGFHLLNVLLHALASCLVVALAARIGAPPAGALLGGVLFAAHPIHTEAVASVVGRTELLSAVGFLAGLLFWLRYRAQGRFPDLAGLLVSFGIGIGSKEQAVMLPFAILATEAAFHRFRDPAGRRRLLVALAVCAVALGIYFGLRVRAIGRFTDVAVQTYPGLLFDESPSIRILTFFKVFYRVAKLVILPIALSPDYSFNQIPIPRAIEAGVLGGALVCFVCAWGIGRAWETPRRFVMACYALFPYFIVSNLAVPIFILLGERTLYLPTAGLCMLAGDWLASSRLWAEPRAGRPEVSRAVGARADFDVSSGTKRAMARAGAAAIVVLFGIRTIDRNLDWRNDLTLFRAAARTSPNSALVRLNYGTLLVQSGKNAEAARELEAAVAILPAYGIGAGAYSQLSYAYERLGNIQAGEEAIRRSLAINDQLPDSWARLGHLLELQGKADQARAAFRREGMLRASAR